MQCGRGRGYANLVGEDWLLMQLRYLFQGVGSQLEAAGVVG